MASDLQHFAYGMPMSHAQPIARVATVQARDPRAASFPSQRPALLSRTTLSVQEIRMRDVGDRYRCDKCSAELVYEKACPCPPGMRHEEICCGQQMSVVKT
jgi:hypothetical protein